MDLRKIIWKVDKSVSSRFSRSLGRRVLVVGALGCVWSIVMFEERCLKHEVEMVSEFKNQRKKYWAKRFEFGKLNLFMDGFVCFWCVRLFFLGRCPRRSKESFELLFVVSYVGLQAPVWAERYCVEPATEHVMLMESFYSGDLRPPMVVPACCNNCALFFPIRCDTTLQ